MGWVHRGVNNTAFLPSVLKEAISKLISKYNEYCYFWSTYCVPGTVLGSSHALSHLILTTLCEMSIILYMRKIMFRKTKLYPRSNNQQLVEPRFKPRTSDSTFHMRFTVLFASRYKAYGMKLGYQRDRRQDADPCVNNQRCQKQNYQPPVLVSSCQNVGQGIHASDKQGPRSLFSKLFHETLILQARGDFLKQVLCSNSFGEILILLKLNRFICCITSQSIY